MNVLDSGVEKDLFSNSGKLLECYLRQENIPIAIAIVNIAANEKYNIRGFIFYLWNICVYFEFLPLSLYAFLKNSSWATILL